LGSELSQNGNDEGIMAGKKYTRSEVVDSVTKKTGMNQKDVRIVIDCLLDDLKAAQ